MKAKVFLFGCIFLGIGLIQLSAQIPLPKNGVTGAISWYEEWDGYSIPITVGAGVDVLTGTANIHNVALVMNNVFTRSNQHMYGEVKSSLPPYEVFKFSDMGHADISSGIGTIHVTLIGELGTRYIATFTYDLNTFELTNVKTVYAGKIKN